MLSKYYKISHCKSDEAQKVADMLTEARRRNRLTQEATAGLIQTTQSVISAYETGDRIPTRIIIDRYVKNKILRPEERYTINRYREQAIKQSSYHVKNRIRVLEARMTH